MFLSVPTHCNKTLNIQQQNFIVNSNNGVLYLIQLVITNVEEPNCRKANFPDRNANTDKAVKTEEENLAIPIS